MDKLAQKEMTKFSLLAVGISAVVATAAILTYHYMVIKDDDENLTAEKAKEK